MEFEEEENTIARYPNLISYECSKKILEQMEKNVCKIKIGQIQRCWILL